MCTSFVVSRKGTFIGMNFDISARPIKLVYQKDGQLLVLQEEEGSFLPALGINQNGTFMNLHMVEANEAGMYRRGKNCVHIMRLFADVLGGKLAPADVPAFVEKHTIVNVPQHSVHSLIASSDGQACVVEPGEKVIELSPEERDFLVLTNFSLSASPGEGCSPGADRYQTACERLAAVRDSFELENGFSILKDTAQQDGSFPTQLSLLAVPEEGIVYFTLHANFEKIYCFTFEDQQIRTKSGFQKPAHEVLTRKGILLSELASWQ